MKKRHVIVVSLFVFLLFLMPATGSTETENNVLMSLEEARAYLDEQIMKGGQDIVFYTADPCISLPYLVRSTNEKGERTEEPADMHGDYIDYSAYSKAVFTRPVEADGCYRQYVHIDQKCTPEQLEAVEQAVRKTASGCSSMSDRAKVLYIICRLRDDLSYEVTDLKDVYHPVETGKAN